MIVLVGDSHPGVLTSKWEALESLTTQYFTGDLASCPHHVEASSRVR